MERAEIITRVQDIFRDVLENDEIELSEETTSDDIEEWDSLSHIQLVVTIEKELGIKFTSYEITSWIDTGEMFDCIAKKLG